MLHVTVGRPSLHTIMCCVLLASLLAIVPDTLYEAILSVDGEVAVAISHHLSNGDPIVSRRAWHSLQGWGGVGGW